MTRGRPQPRVFLGLIEISGYYRGLKEGFRRLGVPCTFIDLVGNQFRYGGADHSRLAGLVRACAEFRKRSTLPLPRALRSIVAWPVEAAARAALFLRAAATHDIFIFGFGTSFLRGHDLRLLRLLGKKVILQYHGSDSRPDYLLGGVEGIDSPEGFGAVARHARARRDRLRRAEKHADAVVNIPPQAHFHQRAYVNWLRIGLPLCVHPCADPGPPRDADRPFRVLHAPSVPLVKGTENIRRAVEEVRQRGTPIDYEEITGRPNVEVLEKITWSDLVIDQVFADYPMPGFACEAACLERPTLIAGYAGELWNRLLAEPDRPPTMYVHPSQLAPALERLARDPGARLELARRAKQFVTEHWAPEIVAGRYLRLASGDIPREWLLDPSQNCYAHGCGISEERLRPALAEYIRSQGVSALALDDQPRVRAMIVEFANA